MSQHRSVTMGDCYPICCKCTINYKSVQKNGRKKLGKKQIIGLGITMISKEYKYIT